MDCVIVVEVRIPKCVLWKIKVLVEMLPDGRVGERIHVLVFSSNVQGGWTYI